MKLQISVKSKKNGLRKMVNAILHWKIMAILNHYAKQGVYSLQVNTPVNTGLAASSWEYETYIIGNKCTIEWYNTDIENGYSVVLLIEFGHGTVSGKYVAPRPFIGKAIDTALRDLTSDVTKDLKREIGG